VLLDGPAGAGQLTRLANRICIAGPLESLAQGRRLGAGLPATALVDPRCAALQRLGHGRSDTSSLIQLLRSGDRDA